ncbi:MAG: hypothetical protein COB90_00585 [Hyphomicrobiales bacterium]|nr:MAG: hypothetical protein COB90_00585 [Hyphomicrobiales bacterium]
MPVAPKIYRQEDHPSTEDPAGLTLVGLLDRGSSITVASSVATPKLIGSLVLRQLGAIIQ